MPVEDVVLEVTESAFALDGDDGGGGGDDDDEISSVDWLKRLGVRIALDDFGTGFSSLSTLATLPVDILKIDHSFVRRLEAGSSSVQMLEGIVGLADRLSLEVVAEGVEEPGQLDLLLTLGCTLGQGYLLARPMSAPSLDALLAAGGLLEVAAPV